jgi:next-to-BRCA1 protein 1
LQLIEDLSGPNTSEQVVNNPSNNHPEDRKDEEGIMPGMSERVSLLERFFTLQTPSHTPSSVMATSATTVSTSAVKSKTEAEVLNYPGVVTVDIGNSQSNDKFTNTTATIPEIRSAESVTEGNPSQTKAPPGMELLSVRQSLDNLIRELPTLVPPPATDAKLGPSRIPLSAAFVEDVTVPDGQIFPPGAEFVKCWRLMNDSGCVWPESTELVFLAGDSLSVVATVGEEIVVHVGKTPVGQMADVWTGELKAPEIAGRYVGYWRLRADDQLFGNSLWIDINVVEADSQHASDESMAASSVIMPTPSSAAQSERVPSVTVTTFSTQSHSIASVTEDNLSDAGSDMSLISMPSSPSDDEIWHETRSAPSSSAPAAANSSAASVSAAMDYVLLYDDDSSDEEQK